MGSMATVGGSLLHDETYADLEIRCEGRSFKVHRVIVCQRSKVLDRECRGGFEESNTRVIKHSVFDADTVYRLLQFIYEGQYAIAAEPTAVDESKGTRICRFDPTWMVEDSRDGSKETAIYHSISCMHPFQAKSFEELMLEEYTDDVSPSIDVLEQHVYVYAIGDYYELPDLKALALQHFQAGKSALALADRDQLIQMIDVIYRNTPSSEEHLRHEILCVCIDQKRTLLKDELFVQAITEHGELQEFITSFVMAITLSQQEELRDEQQSHLEVVKTLQGDIQGLSQEVENVRATATAQETSASQQLQDAQANIEWYKAETTRLAAQLQIAEANAAAAQDSPAAKVMEQLNYFKSIKYCRHCGEDFDYYLERDPDSPLGYVARCDECTTRHFKAIN